MEEKRITVDLLQAFKTKLIEEEKVTATIEKYMRDIQAFLSFLGSRAVEKTSVLAYKSFLEARYSVASANSMIAAINSFFRFAGWNELCIKSFKTQKKAYCTEEKELSREEYHTLVKTAEIKKNERLSLLIQTICATGIRVSELKYITVEAVKEGEATVKCKGKTRVVFIVSALRKKLLSYIRSKSIKSGAIFVTKRGNPMNRSNIWSEMKALCKEAGVPESKVFPHNLRHLFARTFYAIEKDIAKLADILGHSNINTTRIYTISSGREHKRKMERMHLII